MSAEVKQKSKKTSSSTRADKQVEDDPLTCHPCTREGRHVEATKYCAECAEHLCEKCVHDHRKFRVTKDHTITGKLKQAVEAPKMELVEKCPSHEGKVLELFCADHDELCCSVCVAVGHRGCANVAYIPQAAVGVESGLELLEVKESVQRVKADIDDLMKRRQDDQQRVQQQKEDIIGAILDMRIRVSQLLDTLEREARKVLQDRYNEMITKIDIDVKNCEDVSTTLGGLTTKLETIGTDSEPELFVWLKRTKKRMGEDLGSSEDTTGSLALPDGKIILTNAHHKRLKLLSPPAFKVTDHVDLPGKPYDVCAAGPNEVIVSLREEKQLQFVYIDKKMKLSRTMKIGVACYGVSSGNGEIYVACIGGQYENRPQIRIYNMSGRVLRVIERGADEKYIFSTPRNIAVSPDGTLLHVTDREYGVLTLGLYGKVMSAYKGREVGSPRGVACGPDGSVFVCGQNSDNVVQMSAGGEVVGVLLKDKASFHRPQSVCLVQRNHRTFLAVTFMKSKVMRVYALA